MYVPANNPTTSQQAPELSFATRYRYTFNPETMAVFQMAKDLANGKSIKESWDGITNTFEQVQDANKETIKEVVHKAAEHTRKMGAWKYMLYGIIPPITIEKFDEAINQ